MPIRRKGKKSNAGKKKGKKLAGKKKTSKSSSKHTKEESVNTRSLHQLRPGERLVNLLRYHPVDKKELHGVKVSTRVLNHLTPQEVRDLKSVFEIFDCDSDGFLGSVDLWRVLRTLGFKISREETVKVIHDVNLDGRRKINLSEFMEIVVDRQGDARDTYSEIMKGFEMFDLDGAGSISLEKLQNVCRQTGVKLTQKELKDMLEEADKNGDGCVDQSEFLSIMMQTNLF